MEEHQVLITCLNNRERKLFKAGTSLLQIYKALDVKLENPPLVALVNNEVCEMAYRVYKPKQIRFVDINDNNGHRAYVHSLGFLLYAALHHVFPLASLRIEHSVSNGYFCLIKNTPAEITTEDVCKIKVAMNDLVHQNIPFVQHEQETEDVIHIFQDHNLEDKVKLLKFAGKVYSIYYTLGKCVGNFYGHLVPSTGYLNVFGLEKYHDGVLLRMPKKSDFQQLEDFHPQPKLMDIFREFSDWNRIMKTQNIGDLNEAYANGNAFDMIKVAEAFHEKKVANIADRIASRNGNVKVVLVSGPSSSGKTTFSKRLALQLMVAGIHPIALSMDDYFHEREETPLDENGHYDFESIYAIDLELFNQHMTALLNGEEVEIPEFDFAEGKKYYKGKTLQLKQKEVLIIEGIHALNPMLSQVIPQANKFQIYVSAITTISIDDHNWIPTSDNRLIRRIVRDYRYRNYSAIDTIRRWQSVRNGEDKWIYPYQENADIMFNSALIFELAVLKKYAEPILREVPQNVPEYAEAKRLLQFLGLFRELHDRQIPPTSLLREFLGGSSFRY